MSTVRSPWGRAQMVAVTPEAAPRSGYTALRQLMAASTDLLARIAPDGTYLSVSPAHRSLLGYAPADLIGRSYFDLVHPDDVALVAATFDALPLGPLLRRVVHRARHATGAVVWLEVTARAEVDPATGQRIEIHTHARDVTGREDAAAHLREAERRFRLVVASSPIGIALLGTDGRLVAVNGSLCSLLGRSHDALVGATLTDHAHPDDVELEGDRRARLVAGEIARYELEVRYLRPSGRQVRALQSVTLLRSDDGAPSQLIAQIVTTEPRPAAPAVVTLPADAGPSQVSATGRPAPDPGHVGPDRAAP